MSETTRREVNYREGEGRRCCGFCKESVVDPKTARSPRFHCRIIDELADARMLCDRWVALRHQDAGIVAVTRALGVAMEDGADRVVLNVLDVTGILDEVRTLEQLTVQKELAVYELCRQIADLKNGGQYETDKGTVGKDHTRGEQGTPESDRGGPGTGVGRV